MRVVTIDDDPVLHSSANVWAAEMISEVKDAQFRRSGTGRGRRANFVGTAGAQTLAKLVVVD